jgi:UPF0042 nucleotide-binding protein
MNITIVSGLSGSGKSIALNAYEDEGYYCIDNLPIGLLETAVEELAGKLPAGYDHIALGIDARSGEKELQNLESILRSFRDQGFEVSLIYLQSSEDVLIKRYSETRRKHPLTHTGLPLVEAIRAEKEMMQVVAGFADLAIDTSRLNVHELSLLVKERAPGNIESGLSLLIQSFGFKHGIPLDSDFIFDLRCLPNPHWERKLRPFTGLDEPIVTYLEEHEEVTEMYQFIRRFLDEWIPRFRACNRSYVTFSVGCTGGRHRSVYMAEKLTRHLKSRLGESVQVKHRELR